MPRFKIHRFSNATVAVPKGTKYPLFINPLIFKNLEMRLVSSTRGVILVEVPVKGKIRTLFFKPKRNTPLTAVNVVTGSREIIKPDNRLTAETRKAIEFKRRTGLEVEKPVAIVRFKGGSRGVAGTFFESINMTPFNHFAFRALEKNRRQRIAEKLAQTIAKIHVNNIHYLDVHFGNLLFDEKKMKFGIIDMEVVDVRPKNFSAHKQFQDALTDIIKFGGFSHMRGLLQDDEEIRRFCNTYSHSIKTLVSRTLNERGGNTKFLGGLINDTIVPGLVQSVKNGASQLEKFYGKNQSIKQAKKV